MIISVDTAKDTPEAMKAAARLILELAGESMPVREPVPAPRRIVPDMPAQPMPVRMVEPAKTIEKDPDGFEELGLEVYDDNEPVPRSVSVAVEARKEEKKVEKPSSRLPGNVQVY